MVGVSGTRYQVEITAFWDSGKPGNLRVLAAIDDGGWRAFKPLSTDFIMAPDGSFVGEADDHIAMHVPVDFAAPTRHYENVSEHLTDEGDGDVSRPCGRCSGSGVDPDSHRRFTTGGHDERPCRDCGGSGLREDAR
jgi:hypothetical protein